jgi:hypothetical protein
MYQPGRKVKFGKMIELLIAVAMNIFYLMKHDLMSFNIAR